MTVTLPPTTDLDPLEQFVLDEQVKIEAETPVVEVIEKTGLDLLKQVKPYHFVTGTTTSFKSKSSTSFLFVGKEKKPGLPLESLNPAVHVRVADALNTAADLIDRHGWAQNTSVDARGHICASEALVRAVGNSPWAYGLAYQAFTDAKGDLIRYNDNPFRVQSDVTGALRAVAQQVAAA